MKHKKVLYKFWYEYEVIVDNLHSTFLNIF